MIEPGFDKILEEVLTLHDQKTNDYNGVMALYKATGLKGRIADIWRKAIRILTLGFHDTPQKVKYESLRDTALDLIVYTTLYVLLLDEEQKKKDVDI
mgnify:CR=1 FL=1